MVVAIHLLTTFTIHLTLCVIFIWVWAIVELYFAIRQIDKLHELYDKIWDFIWTDSGENLNKFLKDLNEFRANFKFTYGKSKEKNIFLDLVIKLTDGKIVTDLYCKSTDIHQYLRYDWYHIEHIKWLIAFSQTIRLKRICSRKSDLDSHGEDLKNWFSKRGYPEKVIREQVNRALRSVENDKEKDGEHMKGNGAPTYNPNFKSLSFLTRIARTCNFYMQTQKLRDFLRQHLLSLWEVLGTQKAS